MVEPMTIVREKVPEALYAIVGDGEEAENPEKTAELQLESCVDILPPATDEQLPGYYRARDLFVPPDRTVAHSVEGFGIVLLEAQARSQPVITGDSGGTVETMKAGLTGVLVNESSPENLAHEVVQLPSDDERRWEMGREARRHMCVHLDRPALPAEADQLFDALQS